MDAKFLAEKIFIAGVESVKPECVISQQVSVKNNILFIGSKEYLLDSFKNIYVIGAGKASAAMAFEVEKIFGNRITGGHIITKYGHGCSLDFIALSEAGHPIPDANSYASTKKILDIAQTASEDDLVFCLISGGGSSLLVDLPPNCTIDELIFLNELLLKSGADIKEINTVRKHLSKVKGGGLSRAVYPATLITLILSDVVGDPLDSIASGPTVPDNSTFNDAIEVLEKYSLFHQIPLSLANYLLKGKEMMEWETPKPGDPVFECTENVIVGNNQIALEACRYTAIEEGLNTFIVTSTLQGDTIEVAKKIINQALQIQKDENVRKPCCLLFGGETTVKVNGNGVGGRNQHLALYASILLKDQTGITLLSAGTDGNDGPTTVAGAVVDSNTYPAAIRKGLKIEEYLQNFDSFHFFEKAGGQIITGPTMTNVMDIIVVIID